MMLRSSSLFYSIYCSFDTVLKLLYGITGGYDIDKKTLNKKTRVRFYIFLPSMSLQLFSMFNTITVMLDGINQKAGFLILVVGCT